MPSPRVGAFLAVANAATALGHALFAEPRALVTQTQEAVAAQGGVGSTRGLRLELANYIDLQYYVDLSVGTPPQQITGIIDTGSFDLVVFLSSCSSCGKAGAFNSFRSTTHRLGRLVTQLTYGSGDVEGDQAEDHVALGPSPGAVPQHFWEVRRASMPLLQHARFQSIVGVGPPETPAADAWDFAGQAVREVAQAVRAGIGRRLPGSARLRQVESALVSAMEISRTRAMLSNFGITAFSICLGRRPSSSGYLVWNDTAAFEQPSLFSRLQVVGKHSWTVRMTEARSRVCGGR